MTVESAVQQQARLRASQLGRIVWRNNVGAATDETGRLIRYGLGNDSADINRRFKSSDLVGINPVFITPDMVGRVIGQFLAIECKRDGWHMTPGDDRAKAQLAWINLVRQNGGVGGFVTCADDVNRIISGEAVP